MSFLDQLQAWLYLLLLSTLLSLIYISFTQASINDLYHRIQHIQHRLERYDQQLTEHIASQASMTGRILEMEIWLVNLVLGMDGILEGDCVEGGGAQESNEEKADGYEDENWIIENVGWSWTPSDSSQDDPYTPNPCPIRFSVEHIARERQHEDSVIATSGSRRIDIYHLEGDDEHRQRALHTKDFLRRASARVDASSSKSGSEDGKTGCTGFSCRLRGGVGEEDEDSENGHYAEDAQPHILSTRCKDEGAEPKTWTDQALDEHTEEEDAVNAPNEARYNDEESPGPLPLPLSLPDQIATLRLQQTPSLSPSSSSTTTTSNPSRPSTPYQPPSPQKAHRTPTPLASLHHQAHSLVQPASTTRACRKPSSNLNLTPDARASSSSAPKTTVTCSEQDDDDVEDEEEEERMNTYREKYRPRRRTCDEEEGERARQGDVGDVGHVRDVFGEDGGSELRRAAYRRFDEWLRGEGGTSKMQDEGATRASAVCRGPCTVVDSLSVSGGQPGGPYAYTPWGCGGVDGGRVPGRGEVGDGQEGAVCAGAGSDDEGKVFGCAGSLRRDRPKRSKMRKWMGRKG